MPKQLSFPKDELSHPGIIEWWYLNGNLKSESQKQYTYMYCLFRADPKRVKQLKLKLVEYQNRLDGCKPPEAQMDTICKIAVLSRLIENGKVDIQELMAEMEKTYGSGFSKGYFLRACAVIEDYCLTSGANLHGGTGLKSVG